MRRKLVYVFFAKMLKEMRASNLIEEDALICFFWSYVTFFVCIRLDWWIFCLSL